MFMPRYMGWSQLLRTFYINENDSNRSPIICYFYIFFLCQVSHNMSHKKPNKPNLHFCLLGWLLDLLFRAMLGDGRSKALHILIRHLTKKCL